MIKKIGLIVVSAAIVAAGYIGYNKLNYWERSSRIFKLDSSDQILGDHMGRGEGRFEEREGFGERGRFERQYFRQFPDSVRRSSADESRDRGIREGNTPDSLRQQMRRNEGERIERGWAGGGGYGNREGGPGRGGFAGGKKINLRNILCFLAVFASFTVIVIYIDKACCVIRKNRSGQQE